MAPHACDLLGGKHRRLLRKRAAKRVERALDRGAVRQRAGIHVAERPAGGVVAVRVDAELNDRRIRLVGCAQEARKPRRAAEHQRQHATCAGVERAGMADAGFTGGAPDARDRVV
jgi:hypothetical protein